MKITVDDINTAVQDYSDSLKLKSEISVEFDSYNEVDPLLLIRTFDQKPDVKDLTNLAELMFNGKPLTFKYGNKTVKSIVYNKTATSDISHMFSDAPALLDILLNAVYVLMLKKLTLQLQD